MRVLIADDDRTSTTILSRKLTHWGFEVLVANDGTSAWNVINESNPPLAILDWMMPGMDGVDAFKAMKAARPDVRVVLMTAYTAEDRISEAERHGVVRVLSKPVDVSALLSLLTATLNHREPVLIVDQDPVFLKTLSEVLRIRGFRVVQAENLAHAKVLMTQERPLAVLLHVNVSDATAHQAVTELHQRLPTVAMLLYSGKQGAAAEIAHAVPPGWVHAYLHKPFAVEHVTGILNEIRRAG